MRNQASFPVVVADLEPSPVNHDHDTFPANHADVTFVGRPFPLEEAPDHLARLRRWGFTFSESTHACHTHLITSFKPSSTILGYVGGCRAHRTVSVVFDITATLPFAVGGLGRRILSARVGVGASLY